MAKQSILLRSKKKKALAAFQAGRLDEAHSLFLAVCQANRLDIDAQLALGVIAGRRGDSQLAEEYFRQGLSLNPRLASSHYNLGIALRDQKRFEEACKSFKHATERRPKYAEAMDALAHAYIAINDWTNAAEVLEEIIATWPEKAAIHSVLGSVYQTLGRILDAIASHETALAINPRLTMVWNNLGTAHVASGNLVQAENCYRRCLTANPTDLQTRSNLLLMMNYLPEPEPEKVFEEHLEWGRIAQGRIRRLERVWPSGDPQKRLRVGYVSSDFREHSVAYFIEPLLQGHDRVQFEVYCYSYLPRPDQVTLRLKQAVDGWRDIDGLSVSDAARKIRDDRIDILIDLAGHTANNRLGVFVARPAPLQMTYLGYPNTTGLSSIDYRITDGTADPVGEEDYYSERLLRLEGCFLCFQPAPNAPAIAPLPAMANGHITFGSFNNYSKTNDKVLTLWCDVLKRVPGSCLLLKCPALTDDQLKGRLADVIAARGIDPSRVTLLGHTPSRAEHLSLYSRVDIALDTFPYNGTTTTCEALWMGVPVLSLLGQRHAGRVGASLLDAAGLADWLADTPERFVATAEAWAADVAGLADLRASLRHRVADSALCDRAAFVHRFEAALRNAWVSESAAVE